MKKTFFLLAICLLAVLNSNAQMTVRVVRDSLFIPWELVYAPDSNIWFTQKNGYICRMEPHSGHIDTLYHETNVYIQAEGGMLGMAIHPDFPSTPYIYVAYNYLDGSYKERVVRYTYNGNSLSSPMVMIENIAASNYHSGCRLLITGNKLFITTGDATNSANAQNLSSVNGKVLRLNLDGSIPSDNPIANSPVWSWGHRNSQGLVYANNRLYSSEHGPDSDDEINIIQKGRNYGWPNVRGFCDPGIEMTFCNDSNVVEPLFAWTPTLAVCGIDYYNHLMFPALQNSLIMTTLKDSTLYQLQLSGSFDNITSVNTLNAIHFGRLRDVCIGPYGNIFISTSNSNVTGSTHIDKIIELYDPSFIPPQSGIGNLPANGIRIYPNPATDKIRIEVSPVHKLPLNYKIIGVDGQLVCRGQLLQAVNEIAVDELATAVYSLSISGSSGLITTEKIIKK